MTHKDVVIGKTYLHELDGASWRVTVSSVEYDEDRQRHIWNGYYENKDHNGSPFGTHACWGWVSELEEITPVGECDLERARR